MASKEPSLWDDGENDPSAWDYVSDSTPTEESAKQRSSGKKHKSWWEEDDALPRGRQSARSKSKVIGFNYHDTLDDSDDYWYRKNSFQYSRAYDYSPSRQFRSFYSTSYSGYSSFTGGTSDELANKCLNALRTLTRSANTIVDKKENANYLVQIKSDVESVRVAQATDEHKKMLYVSAADLAAAKTTDDEDRVVDELTGFVLLRVQLLEGNKPEIIDKINDTGMHGVTGTIVNAFSRHGATVNPRQLTEDVMIRYLAGLMSKAMLARIARKDVIKSWGGFGPYFARHAAKFAAAETKLKEQPADNTENVVGRVVYNLLNDETPMPLGDTPEVAKDIENILAAHFEAEVAAENMLTTSTTVVAQIHAYFKAKNPEAPIGATGTALEESINNLQKQLEGEKEARKQIEENLMEIGGEFNSHCADEMRASYEAQAGTNLHPADDARELATELRAIAMATDSVAASLSPGHLSCPTYRFDSNTKCTIRDIAKIETPIPSRASAEPEAIEKFMAKANPLLEKLIKKRQEKFEEYVKALAEAESEYAKQAEKLEKALQEQKSKLEALNSKYGKETRQKLREAEKPELPAAEEAKLRQQASALTTARDIMHDRKKSIDYIHTSLRHDKQSVKDINAAAQMRAMPETVRLAVGGQLFNDVDQLRSQTMRVGQLANAMQRFSAGRDEASKLSDALRLYHTYIQNDINAGRNALAPKDLARLAQKAVNAAYDEKQFKFDKLHEFIRQMTGIDIADHDKINAAEAALKKMNLSHSTVENLSNYRGARNEAAVKEIADAIKAAIKQANESSSVDNALFEPEEIAALQAANDEKAEGLTSEAAALVNKEANNAQEEEFVAFLNKDASGTARPRISLIRPRPHDYVAGARATQDALMRNKSSIQNIQNALVFQSGKRSVEEYGMISGDLDEGSLHKLGYESEHVWSRKTMMRLPDVAVGLLIDQSGSMTGRKIDAAREMCIVLAAALQRIKGVRLYIYGHTANVYSHGGDLSLFEHYHPDHGGKLTNLGTIEAIANNYDGYALKEAARHVSKDPAKRKYMFVIADGFPAGSGYGGSPARKHVTSVVKFLKERWHTHTYAFGVGIDNEKDFCAQYGKEHTVFVNNVRACQGKIVRFLRNVLQREKTLVDVAD
jgi:hypothetical protein